MSRVPLILSALLLAGADAAAQRLRFAVQESPFVVAARHLGVQSLGNDRFVHRLEVVASYRGTLGGRFSIVEHKPIADLPRPVVDGRIRLFCLRPDRDEELPARHAPYFKLGGHRGESPLLREPLDDDDHVRFARMLIESEGQAPAAAAARLVAFGLEGPPGLRTEAIEVLRTRTVLRDALSRIEFDTVLHRAVGEVDDVEYKIALASLCGEAGLNGVVDALCLAFPKVTDPRYAQAVGRIARHVHGEGAAEQLLPKIEHARRVEEREALLLALGATGTEGAVDALLRFRGLTGPTPAVDAALRLHGSRRALEAIEKR